jgi:hypothetical protein
MNLNVKKIIIIIYILIIMSGFIPKRVRDGRMQTKTDQPGLKMQGNPAAIGRNSVLKRQINMRVQSTHGLCGLPGDMGFRCNYGVDPKTAGKDALIKYCKFCAVPSRHCIKEAPKHQGLAGGVGRINAPRFSCTGCDFTPTSDYTHPHLRPDFDCRYSKAGTAYSWPTPKFNATQVGTDKIYLTWNPDSCATYYIITNNTTKFAKTTTKTYETYHNNTPFKNGDVVEFSLRSYNKNGSFNRHVKMTISWCSAIEPVKNINYHNTYKSDTEITMTVTWENDSGDCSDINMIEVKLLDYSDLSTLKDTKLENAHATRTSFTIKLGPPPYNKKYDLSVTTHGYHAYKTKTLNEIGPFIPKPPPLSCSNASPAACQNMHNWFGQILPHSTPINYHSGLWGIAIHCDNSIPFIQCVSEYICTLQTIEAVPKIIQTTPYTGELGDFNYLKNHIPSTTTHLFQPNTQYNLQITAKLQNTTCGSTINYPLMTVISGTGSHIPIIPNVPDASKIPKLYVTQYGQSSFGNLIGLFDMTFFSTTTSAKYKEQCWGIVRAWCKEFSTRYINFIIQNKEIVNVQWHVGDSGTILPPNNPGVTHNLNKFTTTVGAYSAVDGPVEFGLAYNSSKWDDIHQIGNPIILDFLIPLAIQLQQTNRVVDLTFSIYPDPEYAMLGMDVGNYGSNNNDSRFVNTQNNESLKYYTQASVPPDANMLPPSWWNASGNRFIGDGTGFGTGRSPYYKIPTVLQPCDFAGTGGTFKYGQNSTKGFPLDNFHQMFIKLYLLNQKIMKLNYGPTGTGTADLPQIPLFTSIHCDGEGMSDYVEDTSYPSTHPTTGELTESLTGKGGPIGQGYIKYLCNKYLPAVSLPQWRKDASVTYGMSPNAGAIVPNSDGVPLWNPANPWNQNQQRNFSSEGVSRSTNDMHYMPLGSSHDGIQRYKYGWIKYQPIPFTIHSEGICESFTEAYNIGEVQPPVIFKPRPHPPPFAKYDKNLLLIDKLPPKNTGQLLPDTLGSGCLTGKFCPGCPTIKNSVPSEYFCDSSQSISNFENNWKMNCITNVVHARIFDKYKGEYNGNTGKNDFRGTSQVGSSIYKSPAMTDIYMRAITKTSGIVPLDGRGYKVDGLTANGKNNSDGFYCPLSAPFITLGSAEIDLGTLGPNFQGTKSNVNGKKWTIENVGHNNVGPMGSIFTIQTTLKGGALTLDPTLPGPQWENTNTGGVVGGSWGKNVKFKLKDYTLSTFVFGRMINNSHNLGWVDSDGTLAPEQSPYRKAGESFTVKFTEQPNFTGKVGAHVNQGSTTVVTGILSSIVTVAQITTITITTNLLKIDFDPLQNIVVGNNTIIHGNIISIIKGDPWKTSYAISGLDSCWLKYGGDGGECDIYGDNTNALGVLQTDGGGFNTMKILLTALGGVMCGDDNSGLAKVGMYSIEFMPMNWIIKTTLS